LSGKLQFVDRAGFDDKCDIIEIGRTREKDWKFIRQSNLDISEKPRVDAPRTGFYSSAETRHRSRAPNAFYSIGSQPMIERAFGLATDLYELTMAAAYFENGIHHRALFELFVRKLPGRRSYLVVAGLEQALDYLSTLRFTSDQIDYLREHPSFKKVSREFFNYLAEFQFTGDVCAMPEGTVAFGMEPLLRITAPIIEAQIVETFLLSTINFQTMIASKAARLVTAARGRSVVEFGTRRAHGSEAGLLAARAAYIGGCIGTSNVEAGHLFDIPTFGTLGHSFVMSFEDEDEAFRAFLRVFPETATVLVDTYDTIAAVKRLAHDYGQLIPAVRLDSGDLCELSKEVRGILDVAGMNGTKIFASGDLNEYRISDLISRGAEVDSFGVGTDLATSYDAPALSGVYKLAGIEENGRVSMRIKLSRDKATYPGAKQVWRLTDDSGRYNQDIIGLADEPNSRTGTWHSLLDEVMKDGRATDSFGRGGVANGLAKQSVRGARLARLNAARKRAQDQLRLLPDGLLALDPETQYQVEFSERLSKEKEQLEREIIDTNVAQ
jgi:nicotinate phosphoribosyltransferase